MEETVCPAVGRRWQWAAPPGWALIRRDFIGALRQSQSFYLLLLVVVTCIAVVSVMWPWQIVPTQYIGGVSREMFAFFALVHLIAAGVLPPGLAALAFASERRQDTLDQLRLSLVSTWGLVVAKLLSSVGLVVLLFVGTLPALGVQMMLVGVSPAEVVGLIVLVLTTALMGATIGLVSAIRFQRPLTAIVMSYVGTAFFMGGFLFVLATPLYILYLILGERLFDGILDAFVAGIGERNLEAFAKVLVAVLFRPYDDIWNSTGVGFNIVLEAGFYRVLVAAICIAIAARLLRRPPKPPRIPKERPIDDPEVLWERRHSFPYYLIDPLSRHPLIPDHANPIFARELRYGLGLRAHWASRIFLASALLYGWAGFAFAWPSGGNMYDYAWNLHFVMAGAMAISVLLVQVLVSNVMTKEREQENYGLLRMTLLSPREMLLGKLGAAVVTAGPLLAGITAAQITVLILVGMVDYHAFLNLSLGFVTLLVCAWFTLCLALCVGVFSRTTAASLVKGVFLNALVYGGPFLAALLIAAVKTPLTPDTWVRRVVCLSPITSYLFTEPDPNRTHLPPGLPVAQPNLYGVLLIFMAAGGVLLWMAHCRLVAQSEQDE